LQIQTIALLEVSLALSVAAIEAADGAFYNRG